MTRSGRRLGVPRGGRRRPVTSVTIVLDAGAFVAVDRNNRDVVALIKRERLAGRVPVTHGGVVGQVWRGGGGGRQANVARLLDGVDVRRLDETLGRQAGVLLGAARTTDVIDAADRAARRGRRRDLHV